MIDFIRTKYNLLLYNFYYILFLWIYITDPKFTQLIHFCCFELFIKRGHKIDSFAFSNKLQESNLSYRSKRCIFVS